MSKNSKGQLVAIIVLMCCTLALVGAAIALAMSGAGDRPRDSHSDSEWTENY